MRKIFKEFKEFINKGSVMNLAVGMIIGSAFTAIVTALVNSILKPLINWIPGTGATGALQTVLREAVIDAEGNVITEALILDWGAVISAIITFLCTAIVLFIIVRGFNKIKETGTKVKAEAKEAMEKLKNRDAENEEKVAEIEEVTVEETKEEPVVEATPATVAEPVVEEKTETTEELLKQIIELLKAKE